MGSRGEDVSIAIESPTC